MSILDWPEAPDTQIGTTWSDPGSGNKKKSLLKVSALVPRKTTAVVNASIMAISHGRGAKKFNKPIVVDLLLHTNAERARNLRPTMLSHVANDHSPCQI